VVTVLDAWALLALLRGEPAGPQVEAVVAAGDTVASWINLGEVFYKEARIVGEARATAVLTDLAASVRAEEPDRALVLSAAKIKVQGGLSYADCFALATAARHGAPLLTGDPEIVAAPGGVRVVDLRLPE
jgi:PIN domain nuclease of toxin-antitoxin system